ncbi:hypothetical protein Dsin_014710 [Dipteronia sinensis]|uniref:Reverse transcriptase domain-containing protein n=1 Tax=Dipteronia sinensis TaxID=43782 RepID=A0AAE0ANE0_9ROSI|nr:hypothetical protein Dsin_014710 [Dipteronia sinensis]
MAFGKGRQIIDSFVVASEIINKWRKDSEDSILVKLDLEKAYVSVNHSFLDDVLVDMSFGDKWRNSMRCCISSLMLSVFDEWFSDSEILDRERSLLRGSLVSLSFQHSGRSLELLV